MLRTLKKLGLRVVLISLRICLTDISASSQKTAPALTLIIAFHSNLVFTSERWDISLQDVFILLRGTCVTPPLRLAVGHRNLFLSSNCMFRSRSSSMVHMVSPFNWTEPVSKNPKRHVVLPWLIRRDRFNVFSLLYHFGFFKYFLAVVQKCIVCFLYISTWLIIPCKTMDEETNKSFLKWLLWRKVQYSQKEKEYLTLVLIICNWRYLLAVQRRFWAMWTLWAKLLNCIEDITFSYWYKLRDKL